MKKFVSFIACVGILFLNIGPVFAGEYCFSNKCLINTFVFNPDNGAWFELGNGSYGGSDNGHSLCGSADAWLSGGCVSSWISSRVKGGSSSHNSYCIQGNCATLSEPPSISSFTVNGYSAAVVPSGDYIKLVWDVSNATAVSISNISSDLNNSIKSFTGGGSIADLSVEDDTIYTLTAWNFYGSTSASVKVAVLKNIYTPWVPFDGEYSGGIYGARDAYVHNFNTSGKSREQFEAENGPPPCSDKWYNWASLYHSGELSSNARVWPAYRCEAGKIGTCRDVIPICARSASDYQDSRQVKPCLFMGVKSRLVRCFGGDDGNVTPYDSTLYNTQNIVAAATMTLFAFLGPLLSSGATAPPEITQQSTITDGINLHCPSCTFTNVPLPPSSLGGSAGMLQVGQGGANALANSVQTQGAVLASQASGTVPVQGLSSLFPNLVRPVVSGPSYQESLAILNACGGSVGACTSFLLQNLPKTASW